MRAAVLRTAILAVALAVAVAMTLRKGRIPGTAAGPGLRIIGITVGAIMAVGAVFGALNTMFAAVASRAREIASRLEVPSSSGTAATLRSTVWWGKSPPCWMT